MVMFRDAENNICVDTRVGPFDVSLLISTVWRFCFLRTWKGVQRKAVD